MNEQEIKSQISKLEREYTDLRFALSSLSNNLNNTAFLRGALSSAGSAAELILKCIYRKEKVVDPKIPHDRAEEIKKLESEKLMLDELIRLVGDKIPLRISTHLRTIQAWRNIGSHDKGEINETVNSSTLQVVSLAMNELVIWFVGEYLNQDTTVFNASIPRTETTENIEDFEQWTEAYWYAMKDLTISKLEQSQLDFIAKKINLLDATKNEIINQFTRDKEGFVELVTEIFSHKSITSDDLEHLEYIRKGSCISIKEASEVIPELPNFNVFSKFLLTENIDFPWFDKIIDDATVKINSAQVDPAPSKSITSKISEAVIDFLSEEDEEEAMQIETVNEYDDEIVTVIHDITNKTNHEYFFEYKHDYLFEIILLHFKINHESIVFNQIGEDFKFSYSINRNENNHNRPLFWTWEKLEVSKGEFIDLTKGTGYNSIKVDVPFDNKFPSHGLYKQFNLGQSVEIIIDRFPNDTQYFQVNIVFGPAAQRINNRQVIFSYKLKFGDCNL